jgi:ABC-type multidrug transport system fused ATPase/permease subunit
MRGVSKPAILPKLLERGRIRDAVLIPALGVAQALALGVGAFATRDAFTALHGNGSPTPGNLATLVAAGLTAAGIEMLSRQRSEALGQSYALSLRHVLYDHLAGMDRREVAARRVGALSLRFVGDLSAARSWFGRGVSRILTAAVVLPGAAAVLYLLNPLLAVVATPPIMLSLMAMLVLAMGLQAQHRSLRGQRAIISIAMMERIAIAPDLDLLDRTDRELAALAEDGAVLRQNAVARITRVGVLRMLPQAGAALAGAAMLWVSGRAGVTPGETAAGLAVLGILMIPLREFADVWDQFCAWRVAREKALALLARPSTRRHVVARGHPVGVRLVGLPLGPRKVDADIPPGALAMLTGPQGSGKSQLGQLIAGLDRAPDGTILYDGQSAPLPRIVHIGDRSIAIQGSLRRSLTLGIEPRPRRRDIETAARTLGLAPLMNRLEGLLGRVGEAARSASDSEALRLDLTRAALSKPDVIVIDAARLWSDPKQATLLRHLRNLTDCTMLLIGPPTASIDCDIIIDLADFPIAPPVEAKAYP